MSVRHMYNYLIIGAGIAGSSLAYRLRDQGSVCVVEAEQQAGYHSSGRSAALYIESYGPEMVCALTRASRPFFEAPPSGFAEHSLLSDRGVLHVARKGQEALWTQTLSTFQAMETPIKVMTPEEAVARVPCLRGDELIGAIEETDAKDIDVHTLLHGFINGARQSGVEFVYNAAVNGAVREGECWRVELTDGRTVTARTVINASGAWGQQVADLFGAIQTGLQPKRRSAFTFKVDVSKNEACAGFDHWPAVVGIDESFYFKPDAGQLMGSPANAEPVGPHDVVAEELDVAMGIDQITRITTLEIRRPSHTWAGLRSFVPDGELVIGWDKQASGFFWLTGQGGYGIQTAPGASLLAADLLLDRTLDASLQAEGVAVSKISPLRFAV